MSKPFPNSHIAKLIIKSVLGTLSKEENYDLNNWLINPINKKFYFKILKNETIEKKFRMFDRLEKDTAYLKLLNRIEARKAIDKPTSPFIIRSMYKYAAILVIMLTVGYTVFNFYSEETPIKTNISIVEDLEPGFNKATLVLEDGSKIELEENTFIKKQALTNIENDKNTLTYNSENKQDSSELAQSVGMNTLYVPLGGIYKLVLPDGTRVWLNSSSSLKYPVSFASDKRIVELQGEAYFEVKRNSKAFIVKTETKEISVLGTAFNVSSYSDDTFFAATLSEGKIKLSIKNQSEVFLEPGQQAIVNRNSLNTIEVKDVDPKVYSAWKDGTFFFENESLDEILHKVGRWYNFKTDFTDADLKNITFTGLVSKEFPAKRLLEMISKSTKVRYEIIQNTTNGENLIKISRRE